MYEYAYFFLRLDPMAYLLPLLIILFIEVKDIITQHSITEFAQA